jgi:pimeloyl-ACP methyl ester carboxylesterase
MTSIYRKGGSPELVANAYDTTLSLWKIPVESRYIETSFGKTHVLITGPENGEPIVLFHGFGFSSTVWLENIQALSEHYRVHAADFPGDINKSISIRPIRNKQECAEWFTELLKGLGVEKVHIGGHSYGGFIAMVLAAKIPERIGKLIIMSPGAAFQTQSKLFYIRCLLAGMMPSSKRITGFMDYMTGKGNVINQTIKNQFIVAMQNALPRNKLFPTYMKDEELKQIKAPALLLIGDQEVQYDPEQATMRACKVMPHIEAHIIKDAGHGLPLEQPERVNRLVLHFLED